MRGVLRRLEFGDAFIFLYAAAFIRQYFWVLPHNRIAWFLSALLAAVLLYLYVSTKHEVVERTSISLWLVIVPVLTFIYSLRAAFPDRSDDVWAYHILNWVRSLRGPLYAANDYFPTALPFNPIPDTLTGITNYLLGYRLGTILNLLALFWAATVIDKILQPFIRRAWLRSASVLVVVLAENLLFEISTYMVDLLTLPLLLQATFLTLNSDQAENRRINFVHVALLTGASVAFKLTNLTVAIPLLSICTYQTLRAYKPFAPKQVALTMLLMVAAFMAPVLPFTVYIYRLTGNPLFPVANTIFKSAFWPTHGGWDDRWGPVGLWQTIAWPVLIWFRPERHSELGLYSGRLSLGFLVAIVGLLLAWRNKGLRMMCLILIASSLLWSLAALGYARYGLFEEALAGIVLVVAASRLISKVSVNRIGLVAAAVALLGCLLLQSLFALKYVRIKEWGHRTTFLDDRKIYTNEASLLLHDHTLRNFLSSNDRAYFDKVEVWFETGPKSTGFEVLLNPHAPIIAVRQAEFFFTRDAWRQFIAKVQATSKKNMYSICLNNDFEKATKAIKSRGLEVGEVLNVSLPFFSEHHRIGLKLIEVRMPQQPEALAQFEQAWMKAAFAANDYREQIVALNPPTTLHPGQRTEIQFKVKNLGSVTWPAVGSEDFRYQVNMGNRWVANGVNSEDNRAVMKADLAPGAETDITLTVNAPQVSGDYILEIDMVHEGVTWFKERGGKPLLLNVRIQP